MVDKMFKFGRSQLVKITVRLSYIFGMWPKKNSSMFYVVWGWFYQAMTTFTWTVAKCIGTVFLEDKKEIILYTASSMYCAVAAYRALIFIRKNKAIDLCLDAISEFSLNELENEIIQKRISKFSKLSTTYTTFIFTGLISALLNPVLSTEKVMPVPIWLPLNWQENERDYFIALVFSYFGIISMVIACAFSPIIVWYLIYGTALSVEVLGWRLRSLGYEDKNRDKTFGSLVVCIKLHQNIVRNIRRIEDTFSSVFLLQIISSAICLCSIAYLMATEDISENLNNFTMYISLGGIYVFEIFVVIYFANDIALASNRLAYHLYESNWINASKKFRLLVVPICENWKKPLVLVVGKIFEMKIGLFTSILNKAYSILNVLRKYQE